MILESVSQYEHKIRNAVDDIRFLSLSDIVIFYSKSVGFFFLFLQFNTLLYLGFFFLSLISFFAQLDFYLSHTWIRNLSLLENLFLVSKFPPPLYFILWIQWFLSICWFLFCLVGYWWLVRNNNNNNRNIDDESSNKCFKNIKEFLQTEDPLEGFYSHTISKNNNTRFTKNQYRFRVLQSFFTYFLLLVIYSVVQIGLQVGVIWIQKNHTSQNSKQVERQDFLFIFVSSVIYSLWKWMSRKLCWFLTQWEGHDTWISFYRYYFAKTYLFDILSFSLFYFARVFILLQQDENDINLFQCYVDWLAEQYVWVLVLDYFGFRLGEFLLASCQNGLNWICKKCSCKIFYNGNNESDDSLRYPFILIEEYSKVIVRQYYVLGAMFVFPMISWIALPLQFVDYYRALYKLVRICARPIPSGNSFVKLLVWSGIFNLIFSLFAYPGFIWIWIYIPSNC